MGNLLENIIDPMTIMIRVVGLMTEYFWFLWEFLELLYFLGCRPRILGGLVIVRFVPTRNTENKTLRKERIIFDI